MLRVEGRKHDTTDARRAQRTGIGGRRSNVQTFYLLLAWKKGHTCRHSFTFRAALWPAPARCLSGGIQRQGIPPLFCRGRGRAGAHSTSLAAVTARPTISCSLSSAACMKVLHDILGTVG